MQNELNDDVFYNSKDAAFAVQTSDRPGMFYSITSPVQAMRVYDTGFAFLLNDKGRIIFHPSISAGKTPEEISVGLSANMFQEPNNGNHLIRYTLNGEQRQLSFSTLSNGMKLVVTAPVP